MNITTDFRLDVGYETMWESRISPGMENIMKRKRKKTGRLEWKIKRRKVRKRGKGKETGRNS